MIKKTLNLIDNSWWECNFIYVYVDQLEHLFVSFFFSFHFSMLQIIIKLPTTWEIIDHMYDSYKQKEKNFASYRIE